MPAVYTYDRTTPQESAGKYSGRPTPNVTAFNSSAPKPLVKVLEPHIPQGIQKIPPPHNRDDSFGQVTASFVHKTIRATPFNNKLKGNPKEQFKSPSYGKVGKQSTDTVSTFANRVKRVIEYLRALQRPDMEDIFKSLIALYVSDRLPNKKELEQIDAVEKLIFQYNIVPPPAPLRVNIPPEPQYSPMENATPVPSPIQIDLVDTIRPLNIETSPSAQTIPTAEPITPHYSQLRPEFILPLKGKKEVITLGPLLDDLRETLGSSDDSDLGSDAPFRERMLEVFSAGEEVSSAEEKYEPFELKVPGLDQEVVAKIQEHLSKHKKNPRISGVSKEQLATFYEYKIEKFIEKHGRLPTTTEARRAKIPYNRLKSYSERT